MDVLIVGSLAYDSLESPEGAANDELGGSASYGGFSTAFHLNRIDGGKAALVGVVGQDFLAEDLAAYADAGLDISGIEIAQGSTFRWKGSYHGDMAEAETHETHLNVFEHFEPKVPAHSLRPSVVFCANLHPALQLSVIEQTSPTRITMLDSMNLWINIAKDSLIEAMQKVDLIVLNDGEVRMLANDDNLVRASFAVQDMAGGGILVVKRGEHGVLALHPDGLLSMPAYPTKKIVDPTGCGDAFAGAMAAFLSQNEGKVEGKELAEALVHATVTASFTLERFGTKKIRNLSQEEYELRLNDYRAITSTR